MRMALILVVLAGILLPDGDRLMLTRTQEAASGHLFSIVGWEAGNFLDKWTHRLFSIFEGGISAERGRELLDEYFVLTESIRSIAHEHDRAAADPNSTRASLEEIEGRLVKHKSKRRSLRNDLEEFLEGAISGTLRAQKIGTVGALIWPPVDFRLESPPRILVTSPRDRIERLESVLLDPDVAAVDSGEIEARILEDQNLSSVVLGLGGLATYPTFVRDDNDLTHILELASHEWLHAYLFFHPLGRQFDAGPKMQILNETIASIAGRELGAITFSSLTGEAVAKPPESEGEKDPGVFDFNSFIRETRITADSLLGKGKIDEAEAYMESRRVELRDHGFFIRKINQAYFAFNGTYGLSPSSVSPIGSEVEELRSLVPDVGTFIRAVREVSNHEQFKAVLEEYRRAAVTEDLLPSSSWGRRPAGALRQAPPGIPRRRDGDGPAVAGFRNVAETQGEKGLWGMASREILPAVILAPADRTVGTGSGILLGGNLENPQVIPALVRGETAEWALDARRPHARRRTTEHRRQEIRRA